VLPVIAHLIENEARGELILVDKAKALIELERNFRSDLSSEKESEESSDSKLKRLSCFVIFF
jgi:hypothetical protein